VETGAGGGVWESVYNTERTYFHTACIKESSRLAHIVTVLHSGVLTLLHCVVTSTKQPRIGFELYPCFLPCMFVGQIPPLLEEQESELNRERVCNYHTSAERWIKCMYTDYLHMLQLCG
jgi:hypothetical protein